MSANPEPDTSGSGFIELFDGIDLTGWTRIGGAHEFAIQDYFEWNRMTIQAEGNVLKTWINGVPVSNLVNDERDDGFFGLQVHSGKAGTILWRNIKVKELNEY